jgi:hypothetical protein
MHGMDSLTIPTPEQLRADIKARSVELRALRRLLRLAEAAEVARQARAAREGSPDEQKEAASA